MSSPRHSPPPSAAVPKPKGILKNAGDRRASQGDATPQSNLDETNARLQWDESNLTLHEIEREQQEARMKIDEPKTPFVRGTSLVPVGDDDFNFDLDGGSNFSGAGPSTLSRRSSAFEQLAVNTAANAALNASTLGQSGQGRDAGGLGVSLDAADPVTLTLEPESVSRTDSNRRSPSFSIPKTSSRRGSSRSATGDGGGGGGGDSSHQRDGIRQEMERQAKDLNDDDGEVEEEADPETQAKHAEFAAKRMRHYGNEAEAMRIAAALADQEEEDDDDEDEAPNGICDQKS